MVHMKKARVGYLKKRSGRVLSGPACDQMFRMWIYRAEGCTVTEITWVGEEQLPPKNSQLRVDKTRQDCQECPIIAAGLKSWPCSAGAESSVDGTVGCRWVCTSWWHRGPLLEARCCRIGRASGQGRGCRRGVVAYFYFAQPPFPADAAASDRGLVRQHLV